MGKEAFEHSHGVMADGADRVNIDAPAVSAASLARAAENEPHETAYQAYQAAEYVEIDEPANTDKPNKPIKAIKLGFGTDPRRDPSIRMAHPDQKNLYADVDANPYSLNDAESEKTLIEEVENQATHEEELKKDVAADFAGLDDAEKWRYLNEMPLNTANDVYRKSLAMELITTERAERTPDLEVDLETAETLNLEVEETQADEILAAAEEADEVEKRNILEAEPLTAPKSEQVKRLEATVEENEALNAELDTIGLSLDSLNQIDEFKELSVGQRFLVAENLKQLTVRRAEEAAIDTYLDENQKLDTKISGASGIQKLGLSLKRGWRPMARSFFIAKAEKEQAEHLRTAGVEGHIKIAEGLIKQQLEGPDTIRNPETGDLETRYLDITPELTPELQKVAESFNQEANEFAKIPHDWSTKEATKEQRTAYEKGRKQFERIKQTALSEFGESSGAGQAIAAQTAAIERDIAIRQITQSDPDIDQALDQITNQNHWAVGFKKIAKEKGGYAVAGAATKMAVAGAVGWMAAPVVAAGFGAWRGYQRGAEELKDKRGRAQRGGKSDTSETAEKIYDASKVTERLNRQVTMLQEATDVTLKIKYANALLRRADLAEAGIQEHTINFGQLTERIPAQYELLKAIGNARAALIDVPGTAENKIINHRLNRFLQYQDADAAKARKELTNRHMLSSAKVAAGFGLLGAAIADLWTNEAGATPTKNPVDKELYVQRPSEATPSVPNNTPEAEKPFDITENLEAQEAHAAAVESEVVTENETTEPDNNAAKETPATVPESDASVIEAEPTAPQPEQKGPPYEPTTESTTTTPTEAVAETLPTSEPYEVQAGDSIWKIVENELATQGRFEGLDEAQRVHLIDEVKDRFAAMSEAELKAIGFQEINGSVDVNQLAIGDQLRLDGVLNDTEFLNSANEHAEQLTAAEKQSIQNNLSDSTMDTAPSAETAPVQAEAVQVDSPETLTQAWEQPALIDATKHYKTLPYIDPFMSVTEKQAWIDAYVEAGMEEGRSTEDIINAGQEWTNLRDQTLATELEIDPNKTNFTINELERTYQNLDSGMAPEPIPETLQMKYFGNVLVDEQLDNLLEPGSAAHTERLSDVSKALDAGLTNGTVLTEDFVLRGRLQVANIEQYMTMEQKVGWLRERALSYVDVYEPDVAPQLLIEHAEADFRDLQARSLTLEMGIDPATVTTPLDAHARTIDGQSIPGSLQMKYFGNISGDGPGVEAAVTETTPVVLSQAEIDEYEKLSPGFTEKYQASLDAAKS